MRFCGNHDYSADKSIYLRKVTRLRALMHRLHVLHGRKLLHAGGKLPTQPALELGGIGLPGIKRLRTLKKTFYFQNIF